MDRHFKFMMIFDNYEPQGILFELYILFICNSI